MKTLYHGGATGLTLEAIRIIRSGQKQAKRGRVYGGFYLTADLAHAQGYAAMADSPTVYAVVLDDTDAAFVPEVTRLRASDIEFALHKGVTVVYGKDPRGRHELAVIDKSVIRSIEVLR